MNKGLGLDELPQTEKLYLEALAKAYNNALSWDTQRLVLSIMSGVASYNVISMYIPGLTKYRYTVAYLHRLQFGQGGGTCTKTANNKHYNRYQTTQPFYKFYNRPAFGATPSFWPKTKSCLPVKSLMSPMWYAKWYPRELFDSTHNTARRPTSSHLVREPCCAYSLNAVRR